MLQPLVPKLLAINICPNSCTPAAQTHQYTRSQPFRIALCWRSRVAFIITTRYRYDVGEAEGRQPVGIVLFASELALDPGILYVDFETCRCPGGGRLHPLAKSRAACAESKDRNACEAEGERAWLVGAERNSSEMRQLSRSDRGSFLARVMRPWGWGIVFALSPSLSCCCRRK